MEPELELGFFDIIKDFNLMGIKHLFFCIPSIDDLIKTKKIRKENVKDLQDIEYLLKAKDMPTS